MKFLQKVLELAPKIKYYAQLALHVLDMMDGVQDFNKNFDPKKKG